MHIKGHAISTADAWRAAAVAAFGAVFVATLPALSSSDSALSALASASTWNWWCALAAVMAQALCLLRASRAAFPTLITVAAIALAAQVIPIGTLAQITLLAIAPAAYVAARVHTGYARPNSGAAPPLATQAQTRAAWVVAALLTWGASIGASLRGEDAHLAVVLGAAALQSAVLVGVPALIGAAVGTRSAIQGARERELIARADQQEARMAASLAEERTAIARELHDIAAHHLSGIALMASAISQQVDADPVAAKASLAQVRTQTKTLLDELRGLVALLRHDHDAAIVVETLAGLEKLVAQAREHGLDVDLYLPPDRSLADLSRGIGPLSQFAAYRTVQEAIANAARHAAGASCSVTLRDTGRAVDIEVLSGAGGHGAVDQAADAAPGFGLRGMQERASLTKSTLTYGPLDGGGWHVNLRVPRDVDAPSLTQELP